MRAFFSELKARGDSPALGVLCGLAVGVLTFAAFSAIHDHGRQPAPEVTAQQVPAQQVPKEAPPATPIVAESETPMLDAPPPAYRSASEPEELEEPDDAVPAPTFRSFRKPEPASPAVPASSSTPLEQKDTVTPPAPRTPTIPEPRALTGPAIETRPLNVQVEVMPKQATVLRKLAGTLPALAGHVPLLGRPFRHDARKNVIAARPSASLEPHIPATVQSALQGAAEVEIEASIDDRGVVQNTEITHGTQTRLDTIAENKVRAVLWKPAREGVRPVPMEMVVRYRFNPSSD
jgi:hypothetical protein